MHCLRLSSAGFSRFLLDRNLTRKLLKYYNRINHSLQVEKDKLQRIKFLFATFFCDIAFFVQGTGSHFITFPEESEIVR